MLGRLIRVLEMFGKMKDEPCFPNLDLSIHA